MLMDDTSQEAQFVTRQSIEDFESLKTILQASVPSIEEHISASKTSEAKDGMKADAEQLVGSGGAFGFPWMEVTRTDGRRLRLFGSDRFEFLANWCVTPFLFACLDPQIQTGSETLSFALETRK